MKSKMLKIAQISLIVFLSLIIVGAVIFGIFKFNYGADIKGYTEMSIELDEYSKDDQVCKEIQADIKDILEDSGYSFAKNCRIAEDGSGFKTLIFAIDTNGKDKSEKIYNDVKSDIKMYFAMSQNNTDFSFENDVKIYKAGGEYDFNLVGKIALAITIIALTTTIYFIIRFGWASGFATLINFILDMALTLSLITLLRVRVDGLSFVVILITALASIMSSLITYFVLRRELKRKTIEEISVLDKTREANLESGKAVFKSFIAIIAVMLLFVCIVPLNVKLILVNSILALIAVGANTILFKSTLRYWIGKIGSTKNKKKR